MNFVKNFEQRMDGAFGSAPQGFTAPISFKKLAKRAVREMENETFVVDGVDTAPALYTILVASADDVAMRPLYLQITQEIANFVEDEGTRRGYAFVGKPLARFMVDPSLRSGKFAVFAENVDLQTLERLRNEEKEFLQGGSVVGGAASGVAAPAPVEIARNGGVRKPGTRGAKLKAVGEPALGAPVAAPQPTIKPTPVPALSSDHLREIPVTDPVIIPVTNVPLSDDSAGLGVIPTDYVDSQYADVLSQIPEPPITIPAAPEPAPQPVTQRRVPAQPAPQPQAGQPLVTCQLIDHQSGRTYTAMAPSTLIGRERAAGGVVLRDPNVSRRHAELFFDGRSWHIRDLQSTNGTLVNDVDIDECALRDGDLITVGLMNLEFRES